MKKKIFGLFVFLMVVILLFLQFYVKNFFKITDIEVVKTMGDATALVSKFSSRELRTNTTFKNINDEAIYKVTLKNNTNKDYKIKKILTSNSSDHIKYETSIINKDIKAKGKASFYLKVIYLKETNFIESKINEPSKITVFYNGGLKTNFAINSHIKIYILLIVIAFILSIINIYMLFRREKNYKEIYYVPIIYLIIFVILLSNALSCIEIRNKITIFNDKLKSFRISFISNGKETSSESIKYGKKIVKPTIYERNGYVFKYWSLDENGKEFDFNTLVNKDIKLYANYDVINYNITYDLDGGSLDKENPKSYTTNDTFTLNNPTKDGYIFDGWVIQNRSNTPILNLNIPINTTGDLLIKAVYIPIDYSIKYNLNGGDYTKNNPSTYNASSSYKISDAKKKGYTFIGWTGTNLSKPTKDLEIKKGTYGDLEFSANYKLTNYSISYTGLNDDEVKSLGNPTSYNINSDDIHLKSPKYRYDNDNEPIDKFIGWEYKGKIYTNPVIYKGSVDDRIYEAKWERLPDVNYTIVYDLDGGSLSSKSKNRTSFTKFDQTFKLNNPSKTGYTFIGWTGSNGSTPQLEVKVKSGTKKNLTFKANYTKDIYNLSYVLNGGTLDKPNKTTYNVDDIFTLNNPSKTGYTFTGWSLDGSSFNPSTSTIIGPKAIGDRTYIANYDLIKYNIKYNLNGGRFTNLVNNTYDINSIVNLDSPVKRGYTFIGWTSSDINSPNTNVRFGPGTYGDLEFTANFKVNTYSIKYDLDGGSLNNSNPSSYTAIDNDITLNNPSKDGYTFIGWSLKDSNNIELNAKITKGSIGNKEYKANYKINTYNIKYNLDGGVNNKDNKLSYTINDTISLKEPSKKGYTFVGWTSSDISTPTKSVSFGPGTYGDLEYTANFDINTYSIKYDLDGGSLNNSNPSSYTIEDNDITLNNPSKDGYTFIGWIKFNGDNPEKDTKILKGTTGNLSFKAVYKLNKYDITYDLDGGVLETNNPSSYTVLDKVVLNNPSKDGYTFVGWSLDNCSTYNNAYDFGPGNSGNLEFKACYNPIRYTISYEGLTDEEINYINNPTSYTIEDNDITLNNPSDRVDSDGDKTDIFIGWSIDGSTSLVRTINKGSIGNKVYKAIFILASDNVYTIKYNLDGGSLNKANKTRYTKKDNTFTLNNPSKDGYTFIGWTGSNGSTPEMEVKINKGTRGNLEYTANYKIINYNIYYDLDGGVSNNPTSYTVNDTFTLNNPSKTGYTFVGWTGSNSFIPEDTVTISKGSTYDMAFKANYTINTYNIKYNLNGGYIETINPSIYNVNSSIELNNPKKDGYTFVGWTGSNGNVPTTNIKFGPGETLDKEYTANYTINTYSISYDLDGGVLDNSNPTSYTIEDNDIILNNPSKNGYTFVGWSTSNSNTYDTNVLIPSGSSGNKSYKANYSLNTYNITYDLDGGINDDRNVNTYNCNDTVTIFEPSKRGYTFIGWTSSDINTPTKSVSFGPGETLDKEFKANYNPITYSISYDLDGGILDKNNPSSYTVEDDITLNNPSKDGYTFVGWKLEDSNTTTLVNTIPRGSIGNKKYKAIYKIIDYNITYDLDGGINNVSNKDTYTINDAISLKEPSKKGYTFVGWTSSDISTPTKTVSFGPGETLDKEFKANFELITYHITYRGLDNNTLTILNNKTEFTVLDDDITLNNPWDITDLDGDLTERFAGWEYQNSTYFTYTIPKGSIGDRELRATYVGVDAPTYSITYDLDGGILADGKENKTSFNKKTDSFKLNNPTKTGYTFIGWTGSNGDTPEMEVSVNKGTRENLEFKANYKLDTYNIEYVLNDGKLSEDNKIEYNIYTDTFTLNNPSKDGYTFVGWTGSNGVNPELNVTIDKGSYGNRYYTANYTKNNYNITYNLDGGIFDVENPTTYDIDSYVSLNPPTKVGYDFIGFKENDSDEIKYNVVFGPGEIGDKTFTAIYEPIKYTIRYNLNNGYLDVDNKDSYTIEDDFTLNNPSKTGYTFVGWTGTDLVNNEMNVNIKNQIGDRAYIANYKPTYYSISYDLDGGVASNPTSYNIESDTFTLNNPTKRGYTFIGWTGSNGNVPTTNIVINKDSIDNKTYKANYVLNTYNITYDLDGGSLDNSNPTTYDINSTFTLNNPTKYGYDFEGWTGSNGNVPNKDITISNEISDKSYKAVFKPKIYNITYTGLTEAEIVFLNNPSSYTIDDNITLNNPPVRTDLDGDVTYIFSGWKENNATTSSMVIPSGSTGNKSFEATWTKVDDVIYTISYNYNGGILDNNVSNITAFTKKYDTFTLNNPSKTGYTFIGWTGSNGDTPEMEVSVNKGTRKNLEFTANYTPINYSISIDLGGGLANNDLTYNIENSYTLNNPTKDGYTFVGWTGSNGSEPQTNVTIPKGSYGDRSYTANYVTTAYNISYNLGSGTLNTSNPTTYYITSSNITLNNPSKTGYTFTGWTGSNGDTPQTSVTIPSGSTGNKSYTANYSLNTYNISYTLNGGTTPSSNPVSYNVNSSTITLSNPSKTGYTFTGWTGSNGTTASTTVKITSGSTGDRSYTANYSANKYTITYNSNNGYSSTKTQNLTYGSSYTIQSNSFTRSGYKFIKWNTRSDGSGTSYNSGKSVSNLTSTSGGNINLYAIWERMNLTNSTLAEMADSDEFSDVVRDNSYDSNPRFIGGNPNNYVWYNGERWRIIGRFYTSGYTYKIMNTNCLRKDFNSTASNSWSSSDLKHDLDYTYWNSISSTYRGYIQNTKWYLGPTELSIPAKNMYSNERSGSTWTGDIALIYPSDYIFATSASGSTTRVSCWTMGGSNWNNSVAKSYGCADNDWIWKNNHTKFNWMITPNSADKSYVHGFFDDGKAGSTPANVLYGSSTSEKNIACPALYLKSSVKFTSGTGTYSNPYYLSN